MFVFSSMRKHFWHWRTFNCLKIHRKMNIQHFTYTVKSKGSAMHFALPLPLIFKLWFLSNLVQIWKYQRPENSFCVFCEVFFIIQQWNVPGGKHFSRKEIQYIKIFWQSVHHIFCIKPTVSLPSVLCLYRRHRGKYKREPIDKLQA